MRIFVRLSVCSAFIGFIGALYSVFCLGSIDGHVVCAAENIFYLYDSFIYYLYTHSVVFIIIFIAGLFSFGWLIVLPNLFFRAYSVSFAVISFSVINIKEATVIIPPLLVSFIIEILVLFFVAPIAMAFSLSIVRSSSSPFSKRFADYILSFLFSVPFIFVSAFCDMTVQRLL